MTRLLEWDDNKLWLFGRWVGIEVGRVSPPRKPGGNWTYRTTGGAAGGSLSTEADVRNGLVSAVRRIMANDNRRAA